MPKKKKNNHQLTAREQQVLSLLTDGYSNEEASVFLNLSRRTVEAHRFRIMLKLNSHNMASLVKYAIQHSLTTLDSYRSRDIAQAQAQSAD